MKKQLGLKRKYSKQPKELVGSLVFQPIVCVATSTNERVDNHAQLFAFVFSPWHTYLSFLVRFWTCRNNTVQMFWRFSRAHEQNVPDIVNVCQRYGCFEDFWSLESSVIFGFPKLGLRTENQLWSTVSYSVTSWSELKIATREPTSSFQFDFMETHKSNQNLAYLHSSWPFEDPDKDAH